MMNAKRWWMRWKTPSKCKEFWPKCKIVI